MKSTIKRSVEILIIYPHKKRINERYFMNCICLFNLVTVSIKTSDGSPISPSGQQLLRKFNSSPVLQQSSKISLSSTSSKISPKHSPHSGTSSHSSPKHQSLPSPKGNHFSTSSPKHSSSAGSGKPSMSTLKSATSSPNSKSSIGSSGERVKTYSSSSSRDRQVIY